MASWAGAKEPPDEKTPAAIVSPGDQNAVILQQDQMDDTSQCQAGDSRPEPISMQDVYKDTPFVPGEAATYAVRYYGVLVGYGKLFVQPPVLLGGVWHRAFYAEASTGDWYKAILVAKDYAKAISRASDFGIVKFRIHQDEDLLLSKHLIEDKWLDFDHKKCLVTEKIKTNDQDIHQETVFFKSGNLDVMGVAYYMRTLHYVIGTRVRVPVYSSQKNWWLDILPDLQETITTEAGSFQCTRLKLQTYIGKELQQKGEVFIWIADSHPHRPMVKIQGDVKLGKVDMTLEDFRIDAPLNNTPSTSTK